MASKFFHSKQYANECDVVTLYAKLTGAADVDADGVAVTSGDGISSVTKTAEGAFTIALAESYPAFLGVVNLGCSVADTDVQFVSEDVDSGTAPNVKIKTITAASAADPDGATIYLAIVLRNSSVS